MMRPHLASFVEDFRRIGPHTAVVVHRGSRRYATTYTDLALLAGRFAAELEDRGVGAGERVVLWGENSAEWIAAFFGCVLRGVIAVPLDAAGSSDHAARVTADIRPRLLVCDRALLATLSDDKPPHLLFSDLERSLPATPLYSVSSSVSAQTPFQIVFTSGTTSEPKGIVHTHRNVLASLEPIEREIEKYRRYESIVHPLRFLHTLPLSHVFGQFMGLWIPVLLAAEVHFESQLQPGRLMLTIRRERISVLVAVPRVLELLRTHLLGGNALLASQLVAAQRERAWRRWWRFRKLHRAFGIKFWAIVCGGASLPSEVEQFWTTLGFALIQGYGLTETTALVTLNHPFRIGRGTIGEPLPGREIRLREDGEIMVRGDMLSSATWQGGRLVQRGQEWLATGDLAAQDPSGQLRFLGRKGDVIVSPSGMNIHPADLESALARQTGVRGCAVVACPVPAGLEPVAVVLFTGSEDELYAAVRGANTELATYQQIRRWLRWPELSFPYTSTGKLLRRRIADWACATVNAQLHPSREPSSQPADPLLGLIASITGESAANVSGDSRLSEDLHLDSLGRVQLQSLLEQQLGVELDEGELERIQTVGDLRALLHVPVEAPTAGDSADNPSQPLVSENRHGQPESPHIYPLWPWSVPIRLLRVAFLEAVMRPLISLLATPRVASDMKQLPGDASNRPLLLIANHVTAYDGALVLYALPRRLRHRVAIAMSGEMLLDLRNARNQGSWFLNALAPAAYWLLTALFNVFPMPRSSGFQRSFAHAGEALDHGYSVLIFPEGHRSEEGALQPFRPGIGLLAQQSRADILPIALKGLGEMKTKKRPWFRSGNLEIQVGQVIPLDEIDEKTSPGELTHTLEETIRRL